MEISTGEGKKLDATPDLLIQRHQAVRQERRLQKDKKLDICLDYYTVSARKKPPKGYNKNRSFVYYTVLTVYFGVSLHILKRTQVLIFVF